MSFKISFKSSVYKDLKKIDRAQAEFIIGKIEKELSNDLPKGKKLGGEFEGLYRIRVGDYRIIYTLIHKTDVLILRISHRKEVYR